MSIVTIFEKIKNHFTDKSLIDDMLVEKGIKKVVATIPDEVIEFLVGLDPLIREVAIGGIVEVIHAVLPPDKKAKVGPLLVSFNRELNDRVEDYKKALCSPELNDDQLFSMLGGENNPVKDAASASLRAYFVRIAVGKLEAPITVSGILTTIKDGGKTFYDEVGLAALKTTTDAHIATRTTHINAQKGKWWSIF